MSLVQNILEKHAPFERLSCKEQKLKSKPWITNNIYAMICCQNKMHKSLILGNEVIKQEFKKAFRFSDSDLFIDAKFKHYTDKYKKNGRQ